MDTNDHDHLRSSRKQVSSTSSYSLQDYLPVLRDENTSTHALGVPAARKLFSYAHLAAVATSLLCFILGAVAITPTLTLAWHLRFNGQIIVIGFLLGIMNLCMQTILPFTFLLLEERFGRSRLQNYQAILSGKFVGSHISLVWRLALLFLLALPLGLSVAYKRFLGGNTTASYYPNQTGRYGISFPRIGSWSPANDALYLFQTSFAAFQSASGLGAATYPQAGAFPLTYGYNTLLLSNDSAAILDMPTISYLTYLQSSIHDSDALHINASVNAYMAFYNTSTEKIVSDDKFWSTIINSGSQNGQQGLSTMFLYAGRNSRIGVMPFDNNDQTLFALYDNSTEWGGMKFHNNPVVDQDVQEFNVFRPRAQIYRIKRARCRGSWTLNTTSIILVGGSCDTSIPVNSSILQEDSMTPFPYDSLTAMAHTYSSYANDTDSVWLRATYVVSMVTMYWARGLFMAAARPDRSYAPIDEAIISMRSSLRAEGLLYFVLAIQPALTVLAFFVAMMLHRTPIGKDFGLVSILSGVEPTTLGLIQGAGLSGKSRKPVRIEMHSHSTALDAQETRIQYSLRRESEIRERSQLKKVTIATKTKGTVDSGMTALALTNLVGCSQMLKQLITAWTLLETSMGALARVRAFTGAVKMENLPGEDKPAPETWPQFGGIEFRNVIASHKKAKKATLNDISFAIPPGTKLALVGRSGSGKSSLIAALLRMMELSSGQIIIDNLDIATLPRQLVRSHLVALSQYPYVLAGTIRENVDSLDTMSNEQVIHALRRVNLGHLLDHPDIGLHAKLNSDILSHRQCQLLCLARAMIRRSSILILDEATASVDVHIDALMQDTIRTEFKHHTIIAAAHRLDTIIDFDAVLVLDQGSVLESDNPQNLLARDSMFKDLYHTQNGENRDWRHSTLRLLLDTGDRISLMSHATCVGR